VACNRSGASFLAGYFLEIGGLDRQTFSVFDLIAPPEMSAPKLEATGFTARVKAASTYYSESPQAPTRSLAAWAGPRFPRGPSMPPHSTEHRRLAAIMFTDMVGYSALSQRNEALALELLEEHREVLRSVFPRHQGNEIKSTGDGFLVEFASALAAVQCAMEIQRLMRQRNEARSAERRVLIRIGIHLGDVVRRENDVFGDGVNIAARIEPLAEPGGICVSRAVYEQIENKVDHALVQLSRPSLKNIQATVEVYRLVLDEVRKAPVPVAPPRSRWIVGAAVAGVMVLAGVVATLLTQRPGSARTQEASRTNSTPVPASVPVPGTTASPALRADVRLLHSFGPTNTDGVNGWGPLVLARDGLLYGTAVNRGLGGGGVVFRLGADGGNYTLLRSLNRTNDGAEPTGGLVEGPDGALYGTTFRGGVEDSGTVFRITRDGSDFRVLHVFAATNDCRNPQSELLVAADGLLYGTATGGGGHGRGGVFRVAPDGSGYAIVSGLSRGSPEDPKRPVGGLIQTADGIFYGTTRAGGARDNGSVFRLDAAGALSVVKSLGLVPGGLMQPEGTLLRAADGLLYGTCTLGGTAGGGGVFRVAPDGDRFEILHHFGSIVDDARQPSTGLSEGPDGMLLGTSMAGGSANLGTMFRLDPKGGGIQVLHHFAGGTANGSRPRSRLIPGTEGRYFGATLNGGSGNLGTVFEMVLRSAGGPSVAR